MSFCAGAREKKDAGGNRPNRPTVIPTDPTDRYTNQPLYRPIRPTVCLYSAFVVVVGGLDGFYNILWIVFGLFWDRFGTILGRIWDRFGNLFRDILGSFWRSFGDLWGIIWGSCWDHFVGFLRICCYMFLLWL